MNFKLISIVGLVGAVAGANAQTLFVWNFNDGTASVNSAANTTNLLSVDKVLVAGTSATASTNFAAANITAFTGTTVGAHGGDAPGVELALQSNANNGNVLTLALNAGAGNLLKLTNLGFSARRSSSGFNSAPVTISTDGVTFSSLGNTTYTGTASTENDLAITNNVAQQVWIRWTFAGASTTTGNNRFDNIVIDGSVEPVPEPATMALLGLGAAAMIRRRRSAK